MHELSRVKRLSGTFAGATPFGRCLAPMAHGARGAQRRRPWGSSVHAARKDISTGSKTHLGPGQPHVNTGRFNA